ncbi:MAG TPA: HAMP domain-containing sensor histidine kinase, partial [Acidimicrobiales bacterium]|nr:HAMP domain-containing sensor histidine kinase [Acidimicrobiales bacterium]
MADQRALRRRLGLRRRVVLTFAVGALALSASLAFAAYGVSRQYLLAQRERSVVDRAYGAASAIGSQLTPPADVPRALSSLVVPVGWHPVLYHDGRWFAASLDVSPEDIPPALRRHAAEGTAARQLFRFQGVPYLAVAVPLPEGAGAFFGVVALEELERTLGLLANVLVAAAAATTVAGAVVGTVIGNRLLRPLTEAAEAASSVGSGRLDVRLGTTGDADLDAVAEAFNDMTAALRERIERDARFASAVSHELRSPLTTLATSVEVLASRRQDLPPRARDALDLLEGELRRFQRLVQDLLEMSRIDAGAAELSLDPTVPAELVSHALRSANAPEVEVEVSQPARDMVFSVDKRRLERVIVNLVENAESHGGGISRVTVEAAEGRVRIGVEDKGPGVAAGDRARIFEPFVRGAASGRHARPLVLH